MILEKNKTTAGKPIKVTTTVIITCDKVKQLATINVILTSNNMNQHQQATINVILH
jgi:hypothetical protein